MQGVTHYARDWMLRASDTAWLWTDSSKGEIRVPRRISALESWLGLCSCSTAQRVFNRPTGL